MLGLEGWLRWFAHRFGGVVCRGHAQYSDFVLDALLLLPALQKWQMGFWSFCILLSIICPNCACIHLILVPYSFFEFCCSRRRLSSCKHCSKGSQFPACLTLFLLKSLPPLLCLEHPSFRLNSCVTVCNKFSVFLLG